MLTKRVIAAIVGLGVVGALVLGVLVTTGHVSAAPPAQAQQPANGSVAWAAGKITALQSNGFTMQGRNQQVTTVVVGTNTWIVVSKNNAPAQGSLADLKVGDTVSVAGTVSGTNQIDARVVQAGGTGKFFAPGAKHGARPGNGAQPGQGARPGFARPGFAVGRQATIQSINNGTLTLTAGKNANGRTETVNTDAGTVVVKNGLASVADLKVGDVVQIVPRRPATPPSTTPGATRPTPTAALIYVPSTDHVLVTAPVQAVNGNTLTLGPGKRTVNVDANTVYKTVTAGQAPANASLSDVKAGSLVVIYAAKPAQGQTATASVVVILPAVQKPGSL